MDKAASPIEAGSTLFYGHISVNQQPVEIFKVYGRTDLTSHVKILISRQWLFVYTKYVHCHPVRKLISINNLSQTSMESKQYTTYCRDKSIRILSRKIRATPRIPSKRSQYNSATLDIIVIPKHPQT